MALIITCPNGELLLTSLKQKVTSGSSSAWAIDEEGDFTLTNAPMAGRAWMRARLDQPGIIFNILGNTSMSMKKVTYSAYHARLLELILVELDTQFSRAAVTSHKFEGDTFTRPQLKPKV